MITAAVYYQLGVCCVRAAIGLVGTNWPMVGVKLGYRNAYLAVIHSFRLRYTDQVSQGTGRFL